MKSKKLNIPTTNFDYAASVQSEKPPVPVKSFPTKSRAADLQKEGKRQEDWTYDLPAYRYIPKGGKKMSAPIVDDSLIGGFAHIGTLTSEEAAHQEKKFREQEKQRQAAAEKMKRQTYNPFAGFEDAFADMDGDDFI